MQTVLFIVCTVPFWTSNVIRMISWIPLLGRNGLVNHAAGAPGLVDQPVEWLLFSDFSVVLAFVHLYTMFMIVPIFNSMMRIDRSLIEAARDAGASGWQTLWHVVCRCASTGILIGSIFVITIVMGDFVTVGVMGGQQIASVGKIIQVQTSYLQFPAGRGQRSDPAGGGADDHHGADTPGRPEERAVMRRQAPARASGCSPPSSRCSCCFSTARCSPSSCSASRGPKAG
jgi:ABC-type sugar transport system permease subunit